MIPPKIAIPSNSARRPIVNVVVGFLKILSIFTVFGLSDRLKAQGTVTNVNTLSESAVQAAINSALPGEEVQLPAGTAFWTNMLIITNNISLAGAGGGNTVVIDDIPSASYSGLIQWSTISNYTKCEISGIQFEDDSAYSSRPDSVPELQFYGFCPVVHVTGCQFSDLYDVAICFYQGTYGCIDHCNFASTNFSINIACYNGALGGFGAVGYDAPDSYGDESWATPVEWGSVTNFIYIEDCGFWYPNAGGGSFSPAVDSINGTRIVFRDNSVTNMYFLCHGTESGGRERGGRAFEIYGNNWLNNDPVWTNTGGCISFRSGTGIIFSNTLTGFSPEPMSLVYYRGSQGFSSWGGMNGQNPWDSNGVLVATGTNYSANGSYYLYDSNNTWTVGQWVAGWPGSGNTNCGYVVQDLSQGGSNYMNLSTTTPVWGLIASNGVHTIYPDADHVEGLVLWATGDKYAIYQVYAGLDQPGRGRGDLLADNAPYSGMPYDTATGRTNWPGQALEPWYDWANANNGANFGFGSNIWYINSGGGEGSWPIIIDGRDFYDNTVKPQYTPLPFPHPLDTAGGVHGGSGSFTLTVVNGSGGGTYTNGAIVSVSADTPGTLTNAAFAFWSGPDVTTTNSASTTVTIPASNLTVKANYVPFPPAFKSAVAAP